MSATSKFIVWDWNGTLFDDTHITLACTNQMLANEGKGPVTLDHFQRHYNVPFESFYLGMGFEPDEVERIMVHEKNSFHERYEPLAADASLRDGATDVLAFANGQGVQSLILSNHIVDPIRAQLRRLEVEHLFAEVLAFASRATQFRDMTKGERLEKFTSTQGIDAAHMMIVGDSIEELHIARELGMVGVGITGGSVSEARLRAEKPDYVIHALRDLKPILRERGFVS